MTPTSDLVQKNRQVVWSKKLLSPTYGVEGSPRTPMSGLVQIITESYLWGGQIPIDADGCLGPKNY